MSEYVGQLDKNVILNVSLIKSAILDEKIPSNIFFYKKYNAFPRSIQINIDKKIPYSHLKKVLNENYKHDDKNDIKIYRHFNKHDFLYVSEQLCDLGDGVIIYFEKGRLEDNLESIAGVEYAIEKMHYVINLRRINYLPHKEKFVDKLIEDLLKVTMFETTEKSLQMICKNLCCFYLTSVKIKKPIITDLKLHYGEEFEKVHNTIVNALKSESSHGLILLHGLPGSGKTHYIRYLIQEITDKKLIYIPPDMTSSISTPEFFPFMLQNTNSILIIEDAENIIKSRDSKETTTQAVANLLNLSDGLLGDSLHQPIIATFNCDVNSIDPALLRKGRLITQYEFGKLSIENSQKLSNELGFKTTITEPMTLADIYGQEK